MLIYFFEQFSFVLEKAFAKIYGSYEAIEWGHAHYTQRDLTGAPGHCYDITKLTDEKMTSLIREAVEKDYIITTYKDS